MLKEFRVSKSMENIYKPINLKKAKRINLKKRRKNKNKKKMRNNVQIYKRVN